MAKKKKKKSDKTPYVHIDIMPEEEQLPDASIASEPQKPPQGQFAPGARGPQRMNDPRRRGEGFEPYAAEVVSASGKGLSKKKADGEAPVVDGEDSDVTPFVIPVFRKSDIPQQGRGMHPMQQRMYGTGQFPPVGGGTPAGNPRQNLSQIQQNLLNHHNVARQQAAQHPAGQQTVGQQMGQGIQPQSMQPSQQESHLRAQQQMRQGTGQAHPKQNTGQFAPVPNQMAAQQHPQAPGQAHPMQQNRGQQVSQSLPMQGTQAISQGAMQAAANAAAARATQSRAAAAQAAIQAAAQAHQASQAVAFQQRQAMAAKGQPAVQAHPTSGGTFQAAAGPMTQPQTVTATTPASKAKGAEGASEDSSSKPLLDPKAAEDSPMFDKPPVSIEEGMRKSTSGRKARRRVIIIIAILLIVLGGGAAAYMLLSEQGVVPRISIETATIQVAPQDSSSAGNASNANNSNGSASTATDPGTAPDTPSGGDLSGTVVYQYTANTASGVEYKVEETVTFQSNGDCQSSTMNMTFPDAASAKTFTDNLARDYGTSFKLDSLNGNNAVVTIDNSGLHLTRDEYENALRYSVSDLVVNK